MEASLKWFVIVQATKQGKTDLFHLSFEVYIPVPISFFDPALQKERQIKVCSKGNLYFSRKTIYSGYKQG